MVVDTSLKAYLNEIAPTLGAKQIRVLEVFEHVREKDFTNSELARELEWSINRVTGRVKELREVGILVESRRRRCGVTGRDVHAWRIKERSAISPRAIQQSPAFHQFPSKTERGRSHLVKDNGLHLACSCRGYYWRGICSHVKSVSEKPADPKDHMARLFNV